MKTRIHIYDYDTNNPRHAEEYRKLAATLKATPGRGHQMHSLRPPGERNYAAGEIELDPKHLFENQWNSDIGRVFDWYEEAVFSYGSERKNIKRGHYLDITPEMAAIRNDTLKCGYTGQQFPASSGLKFNTTQQALGSEYLKESDLQLLRLLPVSTPFPTNRAPLTDQERAELLPLYVEAQTKCKVKRDRAEVYADEDRSAKAKKRFEKDKAEFESKAELMQKRLTEFKAGWQFLFERGLNTQNVIYYEHSGEFSFGWRGNGFSPLVAEQWEKLTEGFPAPFKICKEGEKKCA